MPDVHVKPITKLGEDERGATYDFKTKRTGDFMLVQRKAGTVSGNSYHTGKNAGTNPKTFILLAGSIQVFYRHVDTDQVGSIIVSEPAIIEVRPFVIHAVKGITDFQMLEANSIEDIREDRIRETIISDVAA